MAGEEREKNFSGNSRAAGFDGTYKGQILELIGLKSFARSQNCSAARLGARAAGRVDLPSFRGGAASRPTKRGALGSYFFCVESAEPVEKARSREIQENPILFL
jgi:hypothetical protein